MCSPNSKDSEDCADPRLAIRATRPRFADTSLLTLALIGFIKRRVNPARFRQIAWIGVLVGAGLGKFAHSATLFDGTSMPERQGWSVGSSDGGSEESGPGPLVSIRPGEQRGGEFSVETVGTRIHRYSYDTHSDQLIATIRVKVLTASHNPFDSGFYFSLSDSGVLGDRANSIYITPQEIGFADGLGDRRPIDAANYHDYSLLFRAGKIGVFIDQSIADIRDGVAEPVLSRTIVPGDSSFSPGVVGFGDGSNDAAVGPAANSSYVVEFVQTESLSSRSASYEQSGTSPKAVGFGGPVEVSTIQRQ